MNSLETAKAALEQLRIDATIAQKERALAAARVEAAEWNVGVLQNADPDLADEVEIEDLFISGEPSPGIYEIQDGAGWTLTVITSAPVIAE